MFSSIEEPDHRRHLRDSVAAFAGRAAATPMLRTDIASEVGFSRARWRGMADLGWLAIVLPEDKGGLELQAADLAALHHEVGRAALPEPLTIGPLLVGHLVCHGSNSALADRVVPALVDGSLLATLAWQAGRGALDGRDIGPRATPTPTGWRLTGRAAFVPCATAAEAMIVAADTPDGVHLFWLDQMAPMTEVVRHADGTQLGVAVLDGIELAQDALIADAGTGARLLEQGLDLARFAAAAELLGLMERALEMTLDHLRQRTQFGKPIGAFQALQHRAVNLYIQIELTRSAILRAATALDGTADRHTRAAEVSAAKARAADAALAVIKEAIQMHGAIGYTQEYDLSLYMNRILFLSGWLGNAAAHRARWAELTLGAEPRHDT